MRNQALKSKQLLTLIVVASLMATALCALFYFTSPKFAGALKDFLLPLAIPPYRLAELVDGHSPRKSTVCVFMFVQCHVLAGVAWGVSSLFRQGEPR